MSWLRLLGWASASPENGISSSDDIYPLNFLDHSAVLDILMTWTMRFNDVLDPEMLQASLARVLETGDWKKLGGRFAKKVRIEICRWLGSPCARAGGNIRQGSRYQLHVPPSFTKERPAFTFSNEKLDDVAIEEHPMGRKLPRPTTHASIQSDAEPLGAFSLPANAPTTFQEYVSRGLPPLSLHVVSFADATLVTIVWPHILMDATSLRYMLQAWILSMRGKVAEIPSLMDAKHDVFDDLADPARYESGETSELDAQKMSILQAALFALRMAWDGFFGPKMETRMLCLPKSSIEKLERQVEDELGSLDIGGETAARAARGEVRGRVSKGDILIAWIVHHVASAMPSPRGIIATSAVDLRPRLPGLRELDSTSAVHVQNLLLGAFTILSAAEAPTTSMGEIAAANRRALMEQASSGQLLARLQLMHRTQEIVGGPRSFVGDPNNLLLSFSNWASNDFCNQVDFSLAVVRPGDALSARKNPPGTILCHHSGLVKSPFFFRNATFILGTDHDDNYWLNLVFDSRTLAKVEESVRKLSEK